MKSLILLFFIVQTLLLSQSKPNNLKEKNIQEQLEREKKYSQEQRFYSQKEYDLKSHEVDMESVKNLPDVPDYNKDFDMDHVYD